MKKDQIIKRVAQGSPRVKGNRDEEWCFFCGAQYSRGIVMGKTDRKRAPKIFWMATHDRDCLFFLARREAYNERSCLEIFPPGIDKKDVDKRDTCFECKLLTPNSKLKILRTSSKARVKTRVKICDKCFLPEMEDWLVKEG